MNGILATIDLVLKILLALVSLGGVIFMAGKWWATIQKLVGSTEALHRRMTEDQLERRRRDEMVDALFMQLRLDVRALQTRWSTMRFRVPQPDPGEAEFVITDKGDQG